MLFLHVLSTDRPYWKILFLRIMIVVNLLLRFIMLVLLRLEFKCDNSSWWSVVGILHTFALIVSIDEVYSLMCPLGSTNSCG